MFDIYWGGSWGAFHVGTINDENFVYKPALEFFKENDHFFHLENFPPYQRRWTIDGVIHIDYGSHVNFVYAIPIKNN